MSELKAPETIYLQWGNVTFAGVTWCEDSINDEDVEYVRKDISDARIAMLESQLAWIPVSLIVPYEYGEPCDFKDSIGKEFTGYWNSGFFPVQEGVTLRQIVDVVAWRPPHESRIQEAQK